MEAEKLPSVRTEIPGPESKKLLQRQADLETATVVYPDSFPIAIRKADGSVIEDADGNRFIDWISGISVLNMGFSENIRRSVKAQMDSIWHALEIPTEARIEFMDALRASFPSGMRDYKVMFGISGADACETAINMAHAVHEKAGSTIAFEGAYHGISGGIVAATAGTKYRRTSYSRGFNVVRVPYPYKLWYDYDTEDIIAIMKKIVTDPESGYDSPDSVIVEPVLGEGGYVVPPEGFLKAVREFCDTYGLTMIVDEVQSGMGRTGKMWAFEWENVKPDIVCISKSVGGGIPVSVIYYRSDYDSKLQKPFHMGTYRANPLALAAGAVLLKETPAYLKRVTEDGKKLLHKFSSINTDEILEVRGKGFMIGIEMGKQGVPMKASEIVEIKHSLLRNGLMMHTCGHFSNVFRFMGAINIPAELNELGVEIFRKVVEKR